MATVSFLLVVALAAAAVALPPQILSKHDEQRYHYLRAGDGTPHLVDLWRTTDAAAEGARFTPDSQNVYHLFTRQNPSVSQPILLENNQLLGSTNYNPQRRTIVIIHGWMDSVTGTVNAVLVPAFLAAEDVNVIVVDWSAGAGTINYLSAVYNTLYSGESVARFINWLNRITGASPSSYHLVGHSLGAHQVGIVGRNLDSPPPYITGLDPAFPGWITNDHKFRSTDGTYTEIIHTNSGLLGYLSDLGDVDFYPNGGINMPGCNSQECDHERCYYYLAESLTGGVFTGSRCASYITAMTGTCFLWGSLPMGGLVPKTGSSGIFYLQTNAAPPFARG